MPTTARFKFLCESTHPSGARLEQAVLVPVKNGTAENLAFAGHTPVGRIEVATDVRGLFVKGREYYLDVQPANA